jgi:large subunit ribosomal protein L29
MSLTRRVHRLKIQEIRTFSLEELNKQLNDSYRELFNLRFRLATRQLVNYHEIRNVQKRIARIKTIMKEIELS